MSIVLFPGKFSGFRAGFQAGDRSGKENGGYVAAMEIPSGRWGWS